MDTEHNEGMVYTLVKQHARRAGVLPDLIICSPDMEQEVLAELMQIPLDDRPRMAVNPDLPISVVMTPTWRLSDE